MVLGEDYGVQTTSEGLWGSSTFWINSLSLSRYPTSALYETRSRSPAVLLSSTSWNSVWKNSIEPWITSITTVLLTARRSIKSSRSMTKQAAAPVGIRSTTRSRSFSSAKSRMCIGSGSLRSDYGKKCVLDVRWIVVDARREIDFAERSETNSFASLRKIGISSRFICKKAKSGCL